MEILSTIWFALIIVLWIGYVFLDGFDLGVGMLMPIFARNEKQKRVLLNSIGPVWDGNEVWLITAVGAMFAAFGHWYASLFSALYVLLTICLLCLIIRAVSIEYRGKGHSRAWRTTWTLLMAIGSFGIAFSIGALLAITSSGLPLNSFGDVEAGAFAWFTGPALLGGLGGVGFSLIHGLLYLGLKTDGELRLKARSWASILLPLLSLPFIIWFASATTREVWGWMPFAAAVLCLIGSVIYVRRGAEKRAFALHGIYLLIGMGGVFAALYPMVLPSTIDDAYSLTVTSASSSDYTLSVILIVTVVILPIIIAYQIFSYRMFLNRVKESHIPPAHAIPAAIRS